MLSIKGDGSLNRHRDTRRIQLKFLGAAVDFNEAPLETPDTFLKALGERLVTQEGVDQGLAVILTEHILKASAAQNAVPRARDAIVELATTRAQPPKVEVLNG